MFTDVVDNQVDSVKVQVFGVHRLFCCPRKPICISSMVLRQPGLLLLQLLQ